MSDHHDVEVQLGTEIEELQAAYDKINQEAAVWDGERQELKEKNALLEAEINSLGKIMLVISRTTHCSICAKDNKTIFEDFNKALDDHMEKFPVRILT